MNIGRHIRVEVRGADVETAAGFIREVAIGTGAGFLVAFILSIAGCFR